MKKFFEWIIAVSITAIIIATIIYFPPFPVLPGWEVVIFGTAAGIGWVYGLRWGIRKPFNCAKCMSAWFTFIFALMFSVEHPILYIPVGLVTGLIVDNLMQRYL